MSPTTRNVSAREGEIRKEKDDGDEEEGSPPSTADPPVTTKLTDFGLTKS